MYDSRARERRRQIEEQEALAAQLLQQVSGQLTKPYWVKIWHVHYFSFCVNLLCNFWFSAPV